MTVSNISEFVMRAVDDGHSPVVSAHDWPEGPSTKLSPARHLAVDEVMRLSLPGTIVVIQCSPGEGRTTMLKEIQNRMDGRLVSAQDFVLGQLENHPFKFEEAIYRLLSDALLSDEIVLVDDFDLVLETVNNYDSQRYHFMNIVLRAIADEVVGTRRRLIIVDSDEVPHAFLAWSHIVKVPDLTREDREFLFRALLPISKSSAVDFDELFHFAQNLDCRQIALACNALRDEEQFTTSMLTEFVDRYRLDNNVDLERVEETDLSELKGMDSVLEALRIHVLSPLKESKLSRDLKLKPKRGVVLHGPPGTGKTSIGRAIAHELGAKFFLIDAESADRDRLMRNVRWAFDCARENAPSIVFIDDADVLMGQPGIEEQSELYRYLLAHLDGLHTEKDCFVCVMMTAMDITRLPRPLLRSGRVELWLEIKLPNRDHRLEILKSRCEELHNQFGDFDLESVAGMTEGFSGADLVRVIEDAKNLIAHQLNCGNGSENGNASVNVIEKIREVVDSVRRAIARYRHGPGGVPAGFRTGRVL